MQALSACNPGWHQAARLLIILLVIGVAPTVVSASANQADARSWRLESDQDAMQVYTREEPDSPLRATRAIATLKVRLASVVALLQDTKACADWVVLCVESNELKRVSDSESYIYSRTDMPWPVADRDNIAHVHWSRSADSRTIIMTTRAVPDFVPVREGVLRFNKSDSTWRLTQQADDTVRVEMLCHVEVGGSLPAWLINQIVVDSPRQMLESMRRLLREGRYRDAVLPSMAVATAIERAGN